MRKVIQFFLVLILVFGFTVEPKGKAIPDEFNVVIDPLAIDYDLLEKAMVFHVNRYRRKRGMRPLKLSPKLDSLLDEFVIDYRGDDYNKNKNEIKAFVHQNYIRRSRRSRYYANWYGVGLSQRYSMKYYGNETYFFSKKGDLKDNHFFYGNNPWIESSEDLIRPVHKETYWLLSRSLLQRSMVGARSRGIYKKQMKEWALSIHPEKKTSGKKINQIQCFWMSSTRVSDRINTK